MGGGGVKEKPGKIKTIVIMESSDRNIQTFSDKPPKRKPKNE